MYIANAKFDKLTIPWKRTQEMQAVYVALLEATAQTQTEDGEPT